MNEEIALPEVDQFLQIRSESAHIPRVGEILKSRLPCHG